MDLEVHKFLEFIEFLWLLDVLILTSPANGLMKFINSQKFEILMTFSEILRNSVKFLGLQCTHLHTDMHTDIQTDRHTHTHSLPDRHTDIQTYIQTYRQTYKHTDRQTDRQTDTHRPDRQT